MKMFMRVHTDDKLSGKSLFHLARHGEVRAHNEVVSVYRGWVKVDAPQDALKAAVDGKYEMDQIVKVNPSLLLHCYDSCMHDGRVVNCCTLRVGESTTTNIARAVAVTGESTTSSSARAARAFGY